MLPSRAPLAKDIRHRLTRITLSEVQQPRVHGRQPIPQIVPEPKYRWLGRIQLKQDPNNALHGIALEDVSHVRFRRLQKGIQLLQGHGCKRVRRVGLVNVAEGSPHLVRGNHTQRVVRIALKENAISGQRQPISAAAILLPEPGRPSMNKMSCFFVGMPSSSRTMERLAPSAPSACDHPPACRLSQAARRRGAGGNVAVMLARAFIRPSHSSRAVSSRMTLPSGVAAR